jgi:putative CocE/NonD family hydrolase
MTPWLTPMGAYDQQTGEMRNDVLEAPLTVIGAPAISLFAACDSTSCDIVVRLVDVHPDATAINVSDGNLRVTWAEDRAMRELESAMSPTAITFGTGHAVRLEIAGSSFPVLDRNPGTGVLQWTLGPTSFARSPKSSSTMPAGRRLSACPGSSPWATMARSGPQSWQGSQVQS